jgi:hypothetical protein
VQRPLLIARGANDPQVRKAEADQVAQAMQEKHAYIHKLRKEPRDESQAVYVLPDLQA